MKEFIEAPATSNFIIRKTCGNIEVGIYPVIFGYRIRAGEIGMPYCELDYCAGDNKTNIITLYSLVVSILTSKMNDDPKKLWQEWPRQTVKPMNNDPECFTALVTMTGRIIIEKLPDLKPLSFKFMENIINERSQEKGATV